MKNQNKRVSRGPHRELPIRAKQTTAVPESMRTQLPPAAKGAPPGTVGDSSLPQGVAPGMIPGYKRGGLVRKTGLARVHKGERVLSRKQARGGSRGR